MCIVLTSSSLLPVCLLQGARGANPHATLLRDAIDCITPISVGLQERYDVFIFHYYPTALTNPYIEAICVYLRRMGLLVWVDMKRKTGINKAMMNAIDSSGLFLALVTPEYFDMVDEGEKERKVRAAAVATETEGKRRKKKPPRTILVSCSCTTL
jgi:uncharacterized membrane protein